MKRSIALSLLAALSGSAYATPTTQTSSPKTTANQNQTGETKEMTEKQRIMLEIRQQVGRELQES